ncbi:hypothetical protein [Spirochaeta thermophila]|uniref:DUF998 domain-containing protein n=1 Tax=Winmispira thermophila (strain ATCC 49972 / DSM 6192 / RI 19.B1) TaxID=665571 RepID=E0RR12_WINT6|nr:hypothetical protein [Spirochaeta thermophila]ADN01590.1 hypothetical protein STHERM_c06310 [Spirochaeta thermophila DSM 6192]
MGKEGAVHHSSSALSQKVRAEISFLVWWTFLLVCLSAFLYPEGFDIWNDPLSLLGVPFTEEEGLPNPWGMGLFVLAFLVDGLFSFRIASRIRAEGGGGLSLLFTLAGIGSLLMLAPCTLLNPLHRLGAGLLVGSLWLCTVVLSRANWGAFSGARKAFHLCVHLVLVVYAIRFFLDAPSHEFLQKLALAGLLLGLLDCVRTEEGRLPGPRWALVHLKRSA